MAQPEQPTAASDKQDDAADEPSAAKQAQDEQARQDESEQESPDLVLRLARPPRGAPPNRTGRGQTNGSRGASAA